VGAKERGAEKGGDRGIERGKESGGKVRAMAMNTRKMKKRN